MADLTQMIRWNANFVRGLAQSVLDRAKTIRTSLSPYSEHSIVNPKTALQAVSKAKSAKPKSERPAKKRKKSAPKTKRVNG